MNRTTGRTIHQPGGYAAFLPDSLPPAPGIQYDEEIQSWLSRADWALARLDGISTVLPNPELFIAMYVKKEALLSSQIEGTEASMQGILEFEANLPSESEMESVRDVVNYIRAMQHGIEALPNSIISIELIREMHRILLDGVRGSECQPGQFRRTQNWLGSPGASIREARYIPPPPEFINKLMLEFEKYLVQSDKTPPLIKIALIHAQFETIHPFLDGNGRIGRLLVTLYLIWRGLLNRPLLYLSIFLKRNRAEYYDLLMNTRTRGNWEDWILFFLRGIVETSSLASDTAREIIRLKETLQSALYERSIMSIHAVRLLDHLFRQPVISVKNVQEYLGVSKESANEIVKKFNRAGILKEITGQQRYKRFVFEDYMEIIAAGTRDRLR